MPCVVWGGGGSEEIVDGLCVPKVVVVLEKFNDVNDLYGSGCCCFRRNG